jgi:hypothetical protein
MARQFWESGYLQDYNNYLTLFATVGLLGFVFASYLLEKLVARGMPEKLTITMITILLSANLVYPILMINYLKSSMLSATYFMVFCTGQWLKLVSFHHVMHDNRGLLKRLQKS